MSTKTNHEEVYEKLSSLLNIKFKAQLKGCPIEFYKILLVQNLITNNENYTVIFKNEKNWLIFKNKTEFIECFIEHIDIKIRELNQEFEELNKFERLSMVIKYDENEVYNRHEEIGNGLFKLNQLKEKLIKL